MCHVSCVMYHLSHVIFFLFFFLHFYIQKKFKKSFKKIGQSGGAGRWRVCYQRGLPRLVYIWKSYLKPLGRGGAVKLTQLMNNKAVCRAAPGCARAC